MLAFSDPLPIDRSESEEFRLGRRQFAEYCVDLGI